MRRSFARFAVLLLIALFSSPILGFAAVPNRIKSAVSDAQAVAQEGGVSPRVRGAVDQGRLSGATPLTGLSVNFLPSAAQQAALDTLLQAQQDSSSPSYHKWLTPTQFGAQFGMSESDLSAVTGWLQAHGLQVSEIAPSRNAIHFSGTVAQVEQAFQTELHALSVDGEAHFANTTAPMLPSAFAGTVASVRGLDNFRVKAHARAASRTVPYSVGGRSASSAPSSHPFAVDPNTGTEYVAPEDFSKIYDVNTLYNAGFTGSASYPIGIIGQTAITTSSTSPDISAFRSAFGLSATQPNFILTPNTGSSQIIDAGDLSESELDLEWAGAVAPSAPLYFVYTGNAGCGSNVGCSYDVFTALQYAIQTYQVNGKPLPILSVSYGRCEPQETQYYATYETWFQQANAQGQTILTASGDQGAAACDYTTLSSNSYAATGGLQVSYPASSAYVTGIGGTSFSGDLTSNPTYWALTDDTNFGNELGLFIPSSTWNDSATTAQAILQQGLSASGGGVSSLFPKPSWQIGPGVPADGKRDVPDLSLSADPNHDGFLVCISGSCTGTNGYFNVYGGTSVASPSFAGILAITEQKLGGFQGNINPSIYRIGTNATAYASSFHDITTGTNVVPCVVAASDVGCSGGTMGYSAGTGYDLVTGLGAPDAANFAAALGGVANLNATTNTLTLSATAPVTGQAITFTATIGTGSLATVPTGSVVFTVDAAAAGTSVAVGANGIATFTTTFTSGGPHTVAAVYSGDTNYYGSSSISTVPVTVAASPTNAATTTALTVSASTIPVGGTLTLTATVSTSVAGSLAGSVTFSTATGQIGPTVGVPITVNGSTGTAVYAYTVALAALPVGTDTITATYGGGGMDATGGSFLSSSGTATVTVTNPSITLTATSFSVASGGTGSSTVTIASGGNYSGTVSLVASTASTLSGNSAFVPPTVTVSPGAAGTSTFTLSSATASSAAGKGTLPLKKTISSIATLGGVSFAGLLLFGFRGKGRTRRNGWGSLLIAFVFVMLATGMGCSSSSSTSTAPTTGTFTVTIVGTDINNSTITNSTNITVTVTN